MSDIPKTDNIKASESKDSQTKQTATQESTPKSDKSKSNSQQPAATKASSTKAESKQPAKSEAKSEAKSAEKSEVKSENKPAEKSEAESESTTKVEEKYKVGDSIATANRLIRIYTKADVSSPYRLSSEAKITGNAVGNSITGYFVPVTYRKSGLGAISGYVLISK